MKDGNEMMLPKKLKRVRLSSFMSGQQAEIEALLPKK